MKDYTIPTHNICPRSISFSLEDGKIFNIKFAGGCPGNTKAIAKLLEGTETLKEGMAEYKEEGISKIVDLYDDDIVGLKDRFEAIRKAGRDYQTYTQLSDGEKGSVKFIYKSDEIKAEDNK